MGAALLKNPERIREVRNKKNEYSVVYSTGADNDYSSSRCVCSCDMQD